MASHEAFIPCHLGAVKFFKEKRLWSKEMDFMQAHLSGE